jgi:hypothetical protein
VDSHGRLIYWAKWFPGSPTFQEITSQDGDGNGDGSKAEVGYDIPVLETHKLIRLWWAVTDAWNLAGKTYPKWAVIDPKPFCEWLRRCGFTGWAREPTEWEGGGDDDDDQKTVATPGSRSWGGLVGWDVD